MLLWLLSLTVVLTALVGVGLLLYMRQWRRQQGEQAQLRPVRVRAHREY